MAKLSNFVISGVLFDERFERLHYLSASHLYNLRRSQAYCLHHTVYTKTQADPKGAVIAVRRAPVAENRPGFVRIDSVHQGNTEEHRGVYHMPWTA
jgi:hypothetical protein